MKTNSKIAFGVLMGLVVGMVIGICIPDVNVSEGMGKGDIAKVSKYNKSMVSPAVSAFQEKMLNNPEELQKTAASLAVLNMRMDEFDKLVDIAVEAASSNDDLVESVEKLMNIKKLSLNAKNAGEEAVRSFSSVIDGENKGSANDYEQASQNLALAYMLVDRQTNVGKQFVTDVDTFLKGKDIDEYYALAVARDLWAGYCAGEAVLNNDKEELAYWQKKSDLISGEALGQRTKILENIPDQDIAVCEDLNLMVLCCRENLGMKTVIGNRENMGLMTVIGNRENLGIKTVLGQVEALGANPEMGFESLTGDISAENLIGNVVTGAVAEADLGLMEALGNNTRF